MVEIHSTEKVVRALQSEKVHCSEMIGENSVKLNQRVPNA